jgi:hypothetical protein
MLRAVQIRFDLQRFFIACGWVGCPAGQTPTFAQLTGCQLPLIVARKWIAVGNQQDVDFRTVHDRAPDPAKKSKKKARRFATRCIKNAGAFI